MELKNHNQSSHLTSYSAARSSLCFQRQVLSSVLVVGKSLDENESRDRKVEQDRMAAMLSRLGKRRYSVPKEPSSYGIDPDFDSDPDFDFDPDEMKSQPGAALNADKPRE